MVRQSDQVRDVSSAALVVDDDPILRSLVASKLHEHVSNIIEAEDGADAWRKCIDHNLKIALVDLEMPNMDGIALTRCIRSHPKTRHLPVVMVTGRQDGEALRSALDAGATSYLTKPINWSMFTHHISHLIGLSEAQIRAEKSAATIDSALQMVEHERLAELRKAIDLSQAARQYLSKSAGAGPVMPALEHIERVLSGQLDSMLQLRELAGEADVDPSAAADAA